MVRIIKFDMNNIQLIEHHEIINSTVGYDLFSKINPIDIPSVSVFLKIIYNYKQMKGI